MRRTMLRLAVLVALLAAYPIAALVMARFAPDGTAAAPAGRLRLAALHVSGGEAEMDLRFDNLSDEPLRVVRVALLLLGDGDRPVVTHIEEGAAVVERLGAPARVAPGESRDLGRFRLQVPGTVREPVVSAAITIVREGSQRPITLQTDRTLGGGP